MEIFRRAARLNARLVLRWIAMACVWAVPLAAEAPQKAVSTPPAAATAIQPPVGTNPPQPAGIHGVLDLDSPWRFHIGDDPRWSDPAFDDSSWQTIKLGTPISEQGVPSYTGYAWYRMRLQPRQLSAFGSLPADSPFDLLVASYSIGQLTVYVDGIEAGRTRGMRESPVMYQSPAFAAILPRPDSSGTTVLAIRTWIGPNVPVHHGILDHVAVGINDDIADRLALETGREWNRHVIAGIMVTFLFVCMAALGAILYLAQRHHLEYLWLALLCLSVTFRGTAEIAFRQELVPFVVYDVVELWAGRLFMAVTLEFALHFTGGESRRTVRGIQIAVLLLPIVSLVHLQLVYDFLSITAEFVFCGMVCVLLFRAWRRGRGEAGIMLLPFFLASTADSINTVLGYAAEKHWIPTKYAELGFKLGPIDFSASTVAYAIFLGSLLAVILYRFVRVSQEEQRSAAEIAAARSVQALLIPTQLPSNRHFMLESAYLPANGVGGDFFQALPLADGSMLIVVGDVSGKGLQAAMNASTLVGALRNELSHDPATILNHLNHVMLGASSGLEALTSKDAVASFATCLCARIRQNGVMTIANAGHLSPYRDGREIELSPGLPLGVIAGVRYEQADFQLDQGDRIIFLSDGVVEATNSQGELFGFERTQQMSHESARYIARAAQHFGQTDDITVVSLYLVSRDEVAAHHGVLAMS